MHLLWQGFLSKANLLSCIPVLTTASAALRSSGHGTRVSLGLQTPTAHSALHAEVGPAASTVLRGSRSKGSTLVRVLALQAHVMSSRKDLYWIQDGSSGRRRCGAGVEGKASAGQAPGVPRPPRRSQHRRHHSRTVVFQTADAERQAGPAGIRRAEPFLSLRTAAQQVARPKARVGPSLPSLCPQREEQRAFPTPGRSHGGLAPDPPRKHREEGCPPQRVPGRSGRGVLHRPARARGAQPERAQPGGAAIRRQRC